MNQRIGTCSICGGPVSKFFGAWGGTQPPKASCENCGATQADIYNQYGGSYPTIPMVPRGYDVNGGCINDGLRKGWVDLDMQDVAECLVTTEDGHVKPISFAIKLNDRLKEKNNG